MEGLAWVGTALDSAISGGGISSPPHSVIRLIFEVCRKLVSTVAWRVRVSVVRTPIETMRSVIATKAKRPITVATGLLRRVADRTSLNKPSSSLRLRWLTERIVIVLRSGLNNKDICQ